MPSPSNRLRRCDDRLTIALFCAAIGLPLMATLALPAAEESAQERRRLARSPALPGSLGELGRLPDAVEAWYDDHLIPRDALIRWRSRLWISALHTSPNPGVLMGRDGWWFDVPEAQRLAYRTGEAIAEEEIARWSRSFEERHRWLAERGVAYLLVLVPKKEAVYPEYLPGWVRRPPQTPFEQLAHRLASRGVPALDLGPALRAAKREGPLFHQSDTHWNDAGAYAGYRAILGHLAERVPALGDERPVAVRPSTRAADDASLLRLLGLRRDRPEVGRALALVRPRAPVDPRTLPALRSPRQALQPIPLGVGDPALPRGLVFRDSFANALLPFLSEHFERIVYLWNMDVDPHAVERERPDVVIHEIWEGSVYRRPWGPEASRRWREPARPWLQRSDQRGADLHPE